MTTKDVIINLPIYLFFLCILQVESFYLNVPILLVTIVDEVLFRYIYFLLFSKSFVSILLNSLVYGMYGYFWFGDIFALLGYFFLGFIFSFSTEKYYILQLCIFRYGINIYCI